MPTHMGVSVTQPVGQAMDRVSMVLFRPFDIGKWFVIGFCAWLSFLGESGGGFPGFNFHMPGKHGEGVREGIEQAWNYLMNNIAWIAPLAIGIFVVSFAIGIVVLWLNSRGKFMFLYCVAHNQAEVQLPWTNYAREANSLFVFRLVVSIIGTVIMLPLIGGLILITVRMILREAVSPGGVLAAVGLGLLVMIFGVVFWIITRLLNDFVIPIQFMRNSGCLDAWREFGGLMRGHTGNLVLYFLFRIVISIAISGIVLAVVLVTCCVAGCLLAIPFLGTVLLLPILVFERAYSLHYLAQFGPGYNAFTPPAGMSPGFVPL